MIERYRRRRRHIAFALLIGLIATLSAHAAADARENAAPAARQLVIEDNDFRGPGGSDMQSTLPLLGNRHVQVLGFTVVSGDDWENAEAAALLRFLEITHRTNVPVVDGAVYPLINSVALWRLHEQQFGPIGWKGAWGGIGSMTGVPSVQPAVAPMPQGAPHTTTIHDTAADFLIREVHAHPHQVTIVAAGPLTNLALAIRLDPTFAADTKALVFMGGLIDQDLAQVTSNAAFAEDFNFIFDPEAAHIVLTADWPKMIGIGNVSSDILFTRAIVDRIASTPSALTRYLATYYAPLPMWDEITAAVAVDPTLITKSIDAYMDVDLSAGVDYGHAHLWSAGHAPRAMGVRAVTLVQEIDRPRFIDQFVGDALALP